MCAAVVGCLGWAGLGLVRTALRMGCAWSGMVVARYVHSCARAVPELYIRWCTLIDLRTWLVPRECAIILVLGGRVRQEVARGAKGRVTVYARCKRAAIDMYN